LVGDAVADADVKGVAGGGDDGAFAFAAKD
jgi:hypothetical protein